MYKEANFCGIFLSPFFLCLLITGLIFVPLHWLGDRFAIQKYVWNRPICEAALFVILLSAVVFCL